MHVINPCSTLAPSKANPQKPNTPQSLSLRFPKPAQIVRFLIEDRESLHGSDRWALREKCFLDYLLLLSELIFSLIESCCS